MLGGPRSGQLNQGVDSGCGDWEKLGPGSALSLGADTHAPTGDLYAAYDWGVLRLPAGGTAWVDASRGLPKVAIYELSQTNIRGTSRRVIYAATHGRGGFRLILGGRGGGGGDDD